jgi:ethanolamine utilization protein EutN
MNFAKVIGTFWSTKKDENLVGAKMQIIQPLDSHLKNIGSPIIAVDTIGAGQGELVFYVTAYEAVIPYFKEMAPIDASIVGIIDRFDLEDGTEWKK